MLADFRASEYRFTIRAREKMHLPVYKGSMFRGGFGTAFRRIACIQRHTECAACMIKRTCAYTYIFETMPPSDSQALRNYANIPRPFVIEPPEDDRCEFESGETLSFKVLLFGRSREFLPYFVMSFKNLGDIGLGKGRGRYDLSEVVAVNPYTGQEKRIYSQEDEFLDRTGLDITYHDITRAVSDQHCDSITVEYITPTRLIFEEKMASVPEFHIVFRSLLRRLSSLWYFHQGKELDIDYKGLIERAHQVILAKNETHWRDWERYSSRQGERVQMGGLVGRAVYEGELAGFLPFLGVGELTHVGKGAVFGMGKYRMGTDSI